MITFQEVHVVIVIIIIVYLLHVTKRSTYCFRQDWDDVGCCSEEGKQKQIRKLIGDCDESEAEREVDCCYQTEWVGNTCGPDGKMRQTREATGNCDDLSTERELDCCYQTEWVGNTCGPDGKIKQTREAAGNCDDLSTEREIDCCYQTNWVGNTCGPDGKVRQTREAAGNCDDLSTEREINCGECEHTAWIGSECINNTVTQTRQGTGDCIGEDAYTTRTGTCRFNLTSGGRCGSGYGQCVGGCCSQFGWCGGGSAYCGSRNSSYDAPTTWTYS